MDILPLDKFNSARTKQDKIDDLALLFKDDLTELDPMFLTSSKKEYEMPPI
jgi:hypothetical protein